MAQKILRLQHVSTKSCSQGSGSPHVILQRSPASPRNEPALVPCGVQFISGEQPKGSMVSLTTRSFFMLLEPCIVPISTTGIFLMHLQYKLWNNLGEGLAELNSFLDCSVPPSVRRALREALT